MSTETAKELENQNTVKRLWDEAWNKRNYSIIDEVYASDIQYHGTSAEFHDINEMKKLANTFSSAFHDTKVTLDLVFAKDDLVTQKFLFEGVLMENLKEYNQLAKE